MQAAGNGVFHILPFAISCVVAPERMGMVIGFHQTISLAKAALKSAGLFLVSFYHRFLKKTRQNS
jgi:hypothetical protein